MNSKIFLIILFICAGCTMSNAQETTSGAVRGPAFDSFFTFAWDVNIPTGNKFVDATSFAGGKLEYRKMLHNNMSIGFDLSWNSFYEYKPTQTYHKDETTDITTDLYKYNYTLPLAITLHKYFPGESIFIPYFGVGVGATFARPSIFFNIYELYDDNWGFLVRPELGTIIKFDKTADVGALLGVRYSFSTNQEPGFNIDNLESVGFQLGVCWMY